MDKTAENRLAAARESIAANQASEEDLEILAEHGNLDDLSTLIGKLPETEKAARKLIQRLLRRDASGVIKHLSGEQVNFQDAESPPRELVANAFSAVLGESMLGAAAQLAADAPENGLANCMLDACRTLDAKKSGTLSRILVGDILRLKPASPEWQARLSLFSAFGEAARTEITQAMELAWEADREKLADLLVELAPPEKEEKSNDIVEADISPAPATPTRTESAEALRRRKRPVSEGAVTIAVYNAAFDPIHIFHLRVAQHILNEKIADRVVFVPKGNPRGEREIAPENDRLEMLRVATAGMEGIEVSDFEIAGGEQVRSFEVLQAIEKQYLETGCEPSLSLIVGQETLARMPRWRIFRELMEKFGVLVVPRGKRDPDKIIGSMPVLRRYRQSIRVLKSPFEFELSSTYVRDSVAEGKDIRFLVPDAVREYIIQKSLYKTRYKSRPPYERAKKPVRRPPAGPRRFHWCAPGDDVPGTKIDLSATEGEFAVFNPQKPHGNIPVPGMDDMVAESVEGIWQGLKFIHGRIDTRFFEGRGRKRRGYGRIEGHKFGDEMLDYVEARRMIYLPCYIHVVKTCCGEQVKRLVDRLKSGEDIYLHDAESNPDIENTSSPLSHAALLADYLNREVLGLTIEAGITSGAGRGAENRGPAKRGNRRGHRRGRQSDSFQEAPGTGGPARKSRAPRAESGTVPRANGAGEGGIGWEPDSSADAEEIWDPENL